MNPRNRSETPSAIPSVPQKRVKSPARIACRAVYTTATTKPSVPANVKPWAAS